MVFFSFSAKEKVSEELKSTARVLTVILVLGTEPRIRDARASSLVWLREMRRVLKGVRESWRANSLPRPSEAPVIMAQLEGGPKVRSLRALC